MSETTTRRGVQIKCPNCGHSYEAGTPFSIWLRDEPGLDSKIEHFSGTNLDFLWEGPSLGRTYYSPFLKLVLKGKGHWMLIEEKQYLTEPKDYQRRAFARLHYSIRDNEYRGFHLVQFERTSPADGAIYLDGRKVSREDFVKFMRFEQPDNWYVSQFK